MIFSLLLVLLAHPAVALTMEVQGGVVNQQVKISLDKPALVVFRMNDGVPVYAYGNVVYFIPYTTGTLRIQAISGGETVEKIISVVQPSRNSNPAIYATSYWWDGSVNLPEGNFKKIASSGKAYVINWRTAFGALEAASIKGGFDYTVKETAWGPFVASIASKYEGSEGTTSGWVYQVNRVNPPVGASDYQVKEGDVVVWYFSRGMYDTPATSSMVIRIYVQFENTNVAEKREFNTSGMTIDLLDKITAKGKIIEPFTYSGDSISLKFPEGTVAEINGLPLTKVTIEPVEVEMQPVDGLLAGKIYRLGPAGATFNPPIILSMEYPEEISLEDVNLTIAYYNNSTGIRIKLPSDVNTTLWTVSANVSHFTDFAIIGEYNWKGFPLNNTDIQISMALNYLSSIQNEDGGFSNPGEKSDISKTSWAIMAISAAGQDPHLWIKGNNSPVDYLKNNINESLSKMGTADYARTILAIIAAKEDPRNFNGIDMVTLLKNKVKPTG